MTRAAVARDILARAATAGRKVFGFSSDRPSCEALVRGQVPDDWDWIACEGDREWTRLPRPEPRGER